MKRLREEERKKKKLPLGLSLRGIKRRHRIYVVIRLL